MQSLARRQRDCYRFFINEFNRRTRNLTSSRSSSSSSSSFLSNHSIIDDSDSFNFVLVEGNAGSRTVVLNRPNFPNTSMGTIVSFMNEKSHVSWFGILLCPAFFITSCFPFTVSASTEEFPIMQVDPTMDPNYGSKMT
ncbi:hypothetical protein OSB04_005933, partial [Centaurea solstitialis]